MHKRKFYPTAALLFGFIAAVTVADFVTPVKTFSEMENRPLKTSSEFTFKKLWTGDFQSRYEEVVTDQFAGRDGWITLKSVTESILGKTENNGILYGKSGALYGKLTAVNDEQLLKNIGFLGQFSEKYPMTLSIVPSSYTYAEEDLPMGAGQVDQKAMLESLSLPENVGYFDGAAVLERLDKVTAEVSGESYNLYYNTDHHWKGTTAFDFYRALCEEMGWEAFTADELTLKEVGDFYGTYYSKCKKAGTEPDTLTYFELPFAVETVIDGVEKENWYDPAKFETRDKYAAFLHGNGGLTVLAREGAPEAAENAAELLLIKDSYSNTLAPLFLSEFDRVYVVDLRSFPQGLNALCEERGFEEILTLYSFENLQSDTNFYRVMY